MLKPLEQWICDTCRGIIQSPAEAWLEWLVEPSLTETKATGFRIIHAPNYSPRNPNRPAPCIHREHEVGCSAYAAVRGRADYPLEQLFDRGTPLASILSFLEVDPTRRHPCQPAAVDLWEWTNLIRRLCIPFYEEARLLWGRARSAGLLDNPEKVMSCRPGFLEHIVASLGEEPPAV